jgi:hypothetical protein
MRLKSHIHARFNKFYPLGQDKGAAIVNINLIDLVSHVKPELYTKIGNRVIKVYDKVRYRIKCVFINRNSASM